MAYVGLWCCLLRPELLAELRPGERGYAVGIATNLRQARLLVQSALAVVERSARCSAPLVEACDRGRDHVRKRDDVRRVPVHVAGRSRAGRSSALLLDELAHFSTTRATSRPSAVVRALLPATAQFGDDARVSRRSTPWGSTARSPRCTRRPSRASCPTRGRTGRRRREANPTIDPAFLAAEERRDPEGFRAEYLAEFVGSGGSVPRRRERAGVRRPWRASCDPRTATTGWQARPRVLAPTRSAWSWSAVTAATAAGCWSGTCGRGSRRVAGRSRWTRHATSRTPCSPRSRSSSAFRRAGGHRPVPLGGRRRAAAPLRRASARRADDRADEGRRLRVPARTGQRGRHRATRAPRASA